MTKKSTTSRRAERRVNIPVRYVEGQWEYFHGGIVPVLPDTEADLIVNAASISDPTFLKQMAGRKFHRVLEQGAPLLVSLITKHDLKIDKDIAGHLIPYETLKHQIAPGSLENWSSEPPEFVLVHLATPTREQVARFGSETGGLWLCTQGTKAIGLFSTTIDLPKGVSKAPVKSLNHAFTKLSEAYEPWRISHTGNAYTRILYQEKNEKWYSLDSLRNKTLHKEDQEIARALWHNFMSKVSSNQSRSK